MKLLALILLAILPTVAFARIGETYEQAKARYGEPVGQTTTLNGQILVEFKKDNFKISASFYNLKIYLIQFVKIDGTITQEEQKALVKANFNGEPFKDEGMGYYSSETFTAGQLDRKFLIYNKSISDQVDKEGAAKKAEKEKKEAEKLKGF